MRLGMSLDYGVGLDWGAKYGQLYGAGYETDVCRDKQPGPFASQTISLGVVDRSLPEAKISLGAGR